MCHWLGLCDVSADVAPDYVPFDGPDEQVVGPIGQLALSQLLVQDPSQVHMVFDIDHFDDVLAIVVGESQHDFLPVAGEGDLLYGPDTHL